MAGGVGIASVKPNEAYWGPLRARAKALGSDGCTGVPDWYLDCCLEHDVHCRTGMTMQGQAISSDEAAVVFRE